MIRFSTDTVQHLFNFSYQEWQYNVSGILKKSTDISGVINAEYEC